MKSNPWSFFVFACVLLSICFNIDLVYAQGSQQEEKMIEAQPIQLKNKESNEGRKSLDIFVSNLKLDLDRTHWVNNESYPDTRIFCQLSGLEGFDTENQNEAPINLNDDKGPKLFPCSLSRLIGGEGNSIRIIYVEAKPENGCGTKKMLPQLIQISENSRMTLVSIQTRQLLSFIKYQIGTSATANYEGEPEPKFCVWFWQKIPLSLNRATVEVSRKATEILPSPINFTVITGSSEHVFWSIDGTVKGASQFKYDTTNKTIALKDKPDQLYLGLNYMLGDLFGTLPKLDYRRIVIKAMAAPNKQLDSFGIGLGYRLPNTIFATKGKDSEDHSGFVFFVGKFWTKGDAQNGSTLVVDGRRTTSTRYGIGYSLGAALDWLAPKK